VVAAALWGLVLTLPRTVEPTFTEGLLLIAAVAATVSTALILARRNVDTVARAAAAAAVVAVSAHEDAGRARPVAPTESAAPPPAHPSEPWSTMPDGSQPSPDRPDKGAPLRACPCGLCATRVEDANGYLTSVTAWVIAVERLCREASDAMVKGGWVHLPIYEFASDTEALRDLLVQTCHEGGGTRAIWTIQGLVAVWEQTLLRVEQDMASTVEPGRYLAWHTASTVVRANRHGD